MPNLIPLQCPTCSAQLEINGEEKQFVCGHCGNRYLLDQEAEKIPPAERWHVSPLVTFTDQLDQWFKAGEYEVNLRQTVIEKTDQGFIFLIDIEYQNNTNNVLSCRSNQWVLMDVSGYTCDPFYSDKKIFDEQNRPSLSAQRFANPGGKIRGWLAFRIPDKFAVEKLQFISGFLSTKTVEFKLSK